MNETKRRRAKVPRANPDAPATSVHGPAEPFLAGRRWARLLFLAGLTALTLLPFTGKALHIDDPMYVWAAKQIRDKPLDPYGFDVNWYGHSMRMSEVMKNPPLTSYYMAAVGTAFGWGDRTLHLAFLVPAILVVLGTFLLAKRLCRRPLLAGICTLFTPVFLVSSTNLMSDVVMLAFWVFAVHFWLPGEKGTSALRLLTSGILIACSALSKYYGMALIPLLLVYSLLESRRPKWTIAYLLVPIAILGVYQWATHDLYGRGLLFDAAAYAGDTPSQWGKWSPARAIIGLAFTGGCLGAVCLFPLWTWPRWTWFAGAAMAGAVLAAVAVTGAIAGSVLPEYVGSVWMRAGLLGLFATAGFSLLALGVADIVTRREPVSWLLCLWVLGTFLFAAGVNWTTNGRSILPMVPAAAILIARRVESRRPGSAPSARRTVSVAACAAMLAVGVAYADLEYAHTNKVAAWWICQRHMGPSHDLVFQGHWGFQYYMEALGAKAFDTDTTVLRPGDILAVPQHNSNVTPPQETDSLRILEVMNVPSSRWIATMRMGAGFYADGYGPLPFAVGKVPPEPYHIYQVPASRTE